MATCSIHPARSTGEVPATEAHGDFTMPMSTLGTDTVYGMSTAASAGSHVGTVTASRVNTADCPYTVQLAFASDVITP